MPENSIFTPRRSRFDLPREDTDTPDPAEEIALLRQRRQPEAEPVIPGRDRVGTFDLNDEQADMFARAKAARGASAAQRGFLPNDFEKDPNEPEPVDFNFENATLARVAEPDLQSNSPAALMRAIFGDAFDDFNPDEDASELLMRRQAFDMVNGLIQDRRAKETEDEFNQLQEHSHRLELFDQFKDIYGDSSRAAELAGLDPSDIPDSPEFSHEQLAVAFDVAAMERESGIDMSDLEFESRTGGVPRSAISDTPTSAPSNLEQESLRQQEAVAESQALKDKGADLFFGDRIIEPIPVEEIVSGIPIGELGGPKVAKGHENDTRMVNNAINAREKQLKNSEGYQRMAEAMVLWIDAGIDPQKIEGLVAEAVEDGVPENRPDGSTKMHKLRDDHAAILLAQFEPFLKSASLPRAQ